MGSEFTFYDYVDGTGKNIIRAWLLEQPKKARAKFTKNILALEGLPIAQWDWPLVGLLTDHCAGLFEIRVSLDRQYRILGSHTGEKGKATLLHCFIKKDRKVDHVECDRAFAKEANVIAEPTKCRVEHDYG